eukprot:73887-Prymnesium_polylepis.1
MQPIEVRRFEVRRFVWTTASKPARALTGYGPFGDEGWRHLARGRCGHAGDSATVSYTHLRAHETLMNL